MTARLYFDDPYLHEFTAKVVETTSIEGRPAAALGRTAFYPTGGGQPHDTGALDGAAVLDVRSDGDTVWHVLAAPLEQGRDVKGCVDWPRRFDHMQNHSGQHVLSQALLSTAGAMTVAWRLSDHTLTIDLDQPALSEEQIADAEALANRVVQQALPIRARFVAEQELPTLALRKQPDVTGPLRVVEIGDFDRVACGGLHVADSAQIGAIKALRSERRGAELRLHFVCGQRALDDYTRKHRLVRSLAARLTCGEDELSQALERLASQAEGHFKALRAAQAELVAAEAARLLATQPAGSLLAGRYPHWDGEQVKQLALLLRQEPARMVALAGGANQLVAARSADMAIDIGQALKAALAAVGGRGGGRPDMAQGAAPTWEAAEQALAQLATSL